MILSVEGYRIDATKAQLLSSGGDFVAPALCVGGWLRFIRRVAGEGFWVTAYRSKRDALAGWPQVDVRDPEGRFVPWLAAQPGVGRIGDV